ncbi:MAG: hypothetical protein LBM75_05460 [Myxococcales bacterium]|jgi:hypothetical protein|nr:hypothetical protein [Myxococcales bacterium]
MTLMTMGCIGELDTASSIHDLRILAIQADPPESYLVIDESARTIRDRDRGDIEFRLTTLVADVVDGGLVTRPRHYRVSTCPEPESGRCEGLDGELVLGEGTFTGETFEVDFEFTAAHAGLLEAAIRADAYFGFGGLPVLLSVKVWTDEVVEHAAKTLVLHLPTLSLEDEPVNANPPPPKLLIGKEGEPIGEEMRLSIVGDTQDLDIDPSDAEREPASYQVPTFTGGTLALDESWTYDWFTTRGRYQPESSGGLNPISMKPLSALTTLDLDDGSPGNFVSWVVLRDSRGGVSWTRFEGRFEDPDPL